MRRRAMRRVYRLAWRHAKPILPDPRQRCRSKTHNNYRRPRKKWAASPCSAGISGCGSLSVRLLHIGDDLEQRRPALHESQSESGGNRSILAGQSMPLRDTPPDHRSRSACGCSDEGAWAMSSQFVRFDPEPERYEFSAGPIHNFELARRDFFKLLGAGIAVFAVARGSLSGQETAPTRGFHGEELPAEITAWLHIGEDGKVTAFTGKV